MWPCQEMPPAVKVKTRLSAIQRQHRLHLPAHLQRDHGQRAHQPEDRARGAEVWLCGSENSITAAEPASAETR